MPSFRRVFIQIVFVSCLFTPCVCGQKTTAQTNAIESEEASTTKVPRVLFVSESKGFVHGSVKRKEGTRSPAELALMQLAKDSGEFTVVFSQNSAADLTQDVLKDIDIVAFYTSGNLSISAAQFAYFRNEWLTQAGKGMLGFHSATDTFKEFEPYWDLIGGSFDGHPWGAGSTVTMKIHDMEHPAMKPFGSEKFEFKDEIYQYFNWQPEKVRVLMSLDMEDTKLKRPYHVPVAWCKQVGEGKLFYNNMGHREDTWKKKPFLKSIVGAIRWIAGKESGNAAPNPDISKQQHEDSIRFSSESGVKVEQLETAK